MDVVNQANTIASDECPSVARWPASEEGGDCCSLPATHQIDRRACPNISGTSWGLSIHYLRAIEDVPLQLERRFAPPFWERLDRPHCTFCYSCPRLKRHKTEELISRPFVGENWFRLVLQNRMSAENALGYFFFINHVLFFCPTHTHTISSFMGISSRPFVGENGFRLVPQNRVSTENAVGCLILLDQVLLIAPHIHTASVLPWE